MLDTRALEPAERQQLRGLHQVPAQRDLPDPRPGPDQRLHPRRLQRRQRQPLRPAAHRRHLSRRAADHHHRRHAGRPHLRHRPDRGARRARRARSTARAPKSGTLRIITNKPSTAGFAPASTCRATTSLTAAPAMWPKASSTSRSTTRSPCAWSASTSTTPASSTTCPERAPSPPRASRINNAAMVKNNFNTVDELRRPRRAEVRPKRQLDDHPTVIAQDLRSPGRLRLRAVRRRPESPALRAGLDPRPLGAGGADHHTARSATFDLTYTGGYFNRKLDTLSDYTDYSVAYDAAYRLRRLLGRRRRQSAAARRSSRSSAATGSRRAATSCASPRRPPTASASSPACSRSGRPTGSSRTTRSRASAASRSPAGPTPSGSPTRTASTATRRCSPRPPSTSRRS